MPINLNGILLPVNTPFTPTEDFDPESFTDNLIKWNATGVLGYVQVIQTARRAVPDSLTFIAGAGQQSTRGTISEIETAANAGAQAVLVITPHYYRSAVTQDTLVEHYTAVAGASPIPIILYSMPDLTGITIEPETAARLSEHENIIGMKDSSADIVKFAETVRQVPDGFAM